jgi:hypothetical protein
MALNAGGWMIAVGWVIAVGWMIAVKCKIAVGWNPTASREKPTEWV